MIAAALAWQANKYFGHWAGRRRVYLATLLEESAKTIMAVVFGGEIFFTHLSFGAVEGLWEYFNRRNGYYAGLAALASHSMFGFLTFLVYRFYGALAPALAAGCLAHLAWNYLVVRCLATREKPPGAS